MLTWFVAQPHWIQALVATLFTWAVTALGAGSVFFFKKIDRRVLDGMLGFARGFRGRRVSFTARPLASWNRRPDSSGPSSSSR